MKIALYPGTFDPVTIGHKFIMLRASFLFDKLIVSIGNNSKKQCMFSIEKRLAMLKKIVENHEELGGDKNIEVTYYEGLTADFCKKNDVEYIVRGVRTNTDLSMEMSIANANKLLYPRAETVFLLPDLEDAGISSSIVREILVNNGDVSDFVPHEILDMLEEREKT